MVKVSLYGLLRHSLKIFGSEYPKEKSDLPYERTERETLAV